MNELIREPLQALRARVVQVITGVWMASSFSIHDIYSFGYTFVYKSLRRHVLKAFNVSNGYTPIPNSNKYIVSFEDNGQPYKLLLTRATKRPRNPIASEALETPSDVLKEWQGPYYDFFGNPPTPADMGLVDVDVVDRKGNLLHFSLDEPLDFS